MRDFYPCDQESGVNLNPDYIAVFLMLMCSHARRQTLRCNLMPIILS